VRAQLRRAPHGHADLGLAREVEALGGGDPVAQTGAEERFVVSEEDPQRGRAPGGGPEGGRCADGRRRRDADGRGAGLPREGGGRAHGVPSAAWKTR
jgi:hypothetical protein